MKTIPLLVILLVLETEGDTPKFRRSYSIPFEHTLTLDDSTYTQRGWGGSSSIPVEGGWLNSYLPPETIRSVDDSFKIGVPARDISSNSIEKPVREDQEPPPPQSVGPAVIPRVPPPATPVNAAAANIPTQTGAVFLGSGAIGVVALGNGAYALGSGSIGYSNGRRQPRPSQMVPLYPQLPATPNLIPAAVPSPQPPRITGYEYLQPNNIRFGAPSTNPIRIKLRQNFATPSSGQFPPVNLTPVNIPSSTFPQFDVTLQHSF